MSKGLIPIRFQTKDGFLEVKFDVEWALQCGVPWIEEQARQYIFLLQAKPETDTLH